MAIGSHLAGRAIDVSRTTAAHALSYGITKRFGLSHGHAVAVTLGAFIELHADAARSVDGIADSQDELEAAVGEILHYLRAEDGAEARDAFEGLALSIGLDLSLAGAGANEGDVYRLARTVNVERLGNNPIALDEDQLTTLLLDAI